MILRQTNFYYFKEFENLSVEKILVIDEKLLVLCEK